MAERLPTGRVRRAAKVGTLAGGETARNYATRATNLARGKDGRRAAVERRQMEAAERIVEVLGGMKGAAMKVGQVASFIDTGAFPPEFQEHLQAKLAELRDSAPRVSFEQMRKVIEADLDEPLEDVFDELEDDAFAAASIGQVYRARLHDGRRVAVKAQYPGVAKAVRADLQNLGMIMRVAKRMAPGMDAKAMTEEIRERLTDELDYEHEAHNQRAMARAWRDHPFIVVPDVVTELCHEHVLVSEWIDGTGFEEVRGMEDEVRDRFGEIVFRFFFGSLYRNGHFSGDPHPGNYLLMDDGRLAFLDFGMTKKLARRQIDDEIDAIRCGMEGDGRGLHAAFAREGYLDPDNPEITPDAVLSHFRDVTAWYVEDREVRLDPAYVGRILIDFGGGPASRHWPLIRRMTVPPKAILARRMEGLTLGVLGKLEASANWHRIAREWLFGDPPSTPLGEAEEPFHTRRRARAA